MDKDDIIGTLWIFLIYGYMFAVKAFVPEPYADYAAGAGFIMLIFGMWFQELYLKDKYSPYTLIKAVTYPKGRLINLFVKALEFFPLGRSVWGAETAAILHLGKPVSWPESGKVDKVFVYFRGEWSRRFHFRTTKVRVGGLSIDHPQGDFALMYELPKPIVYHGQPYPQLVLTAAGGDFPTTSQHTIQPAAMALTAPATAVMANGGEAAVNADPSATSSCEEWRSKYMQARAEARTLHQKLIRLEEETEELRDEIKALLKSRPDVNKLAKEMVITYAEHYGSIVAAARALGRKVTISWKWVGGVLVAALFFGYLYMHPELSSEFAVWASTPVGAFTIIMVLIIGGYFLLKWFRR